MAELFTLLICLVVIALIVVGVVFLVMYNSLIGKKNSVEQAFSSIDVMLKKRHDLIPNLVATADQYMTHERELLREIAGLRSRAMSGGSMDERVATENQLNDALGRLIVTVENYPDLKANENFSQLMRTLNEIEEQISAARRAYNASVTDYNNTIQMVPTNIVAGMMSLQPRPWFTATENERENVDVKEMFQR